MQIYGKYYYIKLKVIFSLDFYFIFDRNLKNGFNIILCDLCIWCVTLPLRKSKSVG